MYGWIIALVLLGPALFCIARSRSRFLLLVFAGGLIATGSLLLAHQLWIKFAWEETEAVIAAGAPAYRTGSTRYTPKLMYAFSYKGETYHGSRIAFERLHLDRESAWILSQKLTNSGTCRVRFDPNDPTRSMIDPFPGRLPGVLILLGLVPLGIYNLFRHRPIEALRRDEALIGSRLPGTPPERLLQERGLSHSREPRPICHESVKDL